MSLLPDLREGQVKPFSDGIPRINWDHPLAAGLVVYAYDSGGVVTDLVANGVGAVFPSTSHLSNQSSKFGRGVKYTSSAASDWIALPQAAGPTSLTKTAPFTVACGTFYTTLPAVNGTNVCIAGADNSNTVGAGWYISSGSTIRALLNAQTFYNTPVAANTFQTWSIVALGTTSSRFYANGVLDTTDTNTTTTDLTSRGGQVIFNTSLSPSGTAGFMGGAGDGFVYYVAAWNRSLSDAENLLLHTDPYCFLIYPEDEIAAAVVAQAAASGFAVTVDFGGSLEILAGISSDAGNLLEYLASVRADRPLQLEAIAAIRRDLACSPEFVAGLSASSAANLEFLGSLRADNAGPMEMVAALRSDVVMLSEVLSARRSDMAAAGEILAALRADLVGPLENLGGVLVVANAAVPIETTARVIADDVTGVESISASRADLGLAAESLAGVMRQAPAPAEAIVAVQGNAGVPAENLGGVAVVANAALQLEVLGKVAADKGAGAELLTARRADMGAASESLAGVARHAAGSVEFVAGQRTDAGAQLEVTGGVAITASAPVPIEWTGKLAAFGAAVVEILQAFAGFVLSPRLARPSAAERLVQPREAARRVIVRGEGRDTTPEG